MEEEVSGAPPPVQTQAEVFVFSEHAIASFIAGYYLGNM